MADYVLPDSAFLTAVVRACSRKSGNFRSDCFLAVQRPRSVDSWSHSCTHGALATAESILLSLSLCIHIFLPMHRHPWRVFIVRLCALQRSFCRHSVRPSVCLSAQRVLCDKTK